MRPVPRVYTHAVNIIWSTPKGNVGTTHEGVVISQGMFHALFIYFPDVPSDITFRR